MNKMPEIQGGLVEFGEDGERESITFKENGHFKHYKLEPMGWEEYVHHRGASNVTLVKPE